MSCSSKVPHSQLNSQNNRYFYGIYWLSGRNRTEWWKENAEEKEREKMTTTTVKNILPINNKFLFYFFSIYNLEMEKKYPLYTSFLSLWPSSSRFRKPVMWHTQHFLLLYLSSFSITFHEEFLDQFSLDGEKSRHVFRKLYLLSLNLCWWWCLLPCLINKWNWMPIVIHWSSRLAGTFHICIAC